MPLKLLQDVFEWLDPEELFVPQGARLATPEEFESFSTACLERLREVRERDPSWTPTRDHAQERLIIFPAGTQGVPAKDPEWSDEDLREMNLRCMSVNGYTMCLPSSWLQEVVLINYPLEEGWPERMQQRVARLEAFLQDPPQQDFAKKAAEFLEQYRQEFGAGRTGLPAPHPQGPR